MNKPRTWAELAERTGLTFKVMKGVPSVTGTYRGRRHYLDTFTKTRWVDGPLDLNTMSGYAEHITCTRIRLSVNAPAGTKLSVSENFGGISEKPLGAKGVQIGNEQFDREFIIERRPNRLAARVFASPELRQRLLDNFPMEFNLLGPDLFWEAEYVVKDIEYLHSLFDVLCDVAEAVEEAVKTDSVSQ